MVSSGVNPYFYQVLCVPRRSSLAGPLFKLPNLKNMRMQTTLLNSALAALLLTACTTPPPCPPVVEHFEHPVFSIPAEADANIAAVEGYLNALITANDPGIRASVGAGFYANNTWLPADSSDVDGIVDQWMQHDSTRSDQRIKRTFAQAIQIAEGNAYPGHWVQFWGEYSATDKATGKPYTALFMLDAHVKEGKLVKTYLHFDRLSVFNQLGIAPPAPAAEK